jgi:hypothetical protein
LEEEETHQIHQTPKKLPKLSSMLRPGQGDDADDAAILAAAGHGGQAFPPLPAGNAAHVFLPDWTHGRIAGMHMNLIEGIVGIYSDKTE